MTSQVKVVYARWDAVAREVRLDVLLNVLLNGEFTRRPEDYEVVATTRGAGDAVQTCDRVWAALNDDSERPHRSMSVGDGLLFPDDMLWVAQRTGWKAFKTTRAFVTALSVAGYAKEI